MITIAIYNTTTGKISRFYSGPDGHAVIQCQEQEEFYLNCPAEATHIVNNEPVTIGPPPPTLGELKTTKKNEIKMYFTSAFNQGYTTKGLLTNIKLDCKRDDLVNFQSIAQYMETTNNTTTVIKDFNNDFHQDVPLADLKTIVNELIAYGLWLYQHKWEKEAEIDATTEETIGSIVW